MAQTFLSQLLKDPNHKIVITFPSGFGFVEGFISGDFTISTGSSYTTLFTAQQQEDLTRKLNILSATLRTVGKAVGFEKYTSFAQVALKSEFQTRLSWVGESKPKFSLKLIFVAIKEGDDVRKLAEKVYQAVIPEYKSTTIFKKSRFETKLGIYTAPFNYNPADASGLSTISIGRWLKIPECVLTSVSFTYSESLVQLDEINTAPLYCEGTIQFEPYKAISFKDFQKWFTTKKPTPVATTGEAYSDPTRMLA